MIQKIVPIVLIGLFPALVLAASGAADGHHGNPAPDLDLLLREFNFLIFAVLMFFLLRKPVKEFFAARASSIRHSVEGARRTHEQAVVQNEEIQTRLKNLERETSALIQKFKHEGELEKRRIVEQAHEMAEQIRADTARVAEMEVLKAKQELKDTVIILSRDLAEKSIRNELSDADDERLSQNYVKKLKSLH